jgi:hypothetical protein
VVEADLYVTLNVVSPPLQQSGEPSSLAKGLSLEQVKGAATVAAGLPTLQATPYPFPQLLAEEPLVLSQVTYPFPQLTQEE